MGKGRKEVKLGLDQTYEFFQNNFNAGQYLVVVVIVLYSNTTYDTF